MTRNYLPRFALLLIAGFTLPNSVLAQDEQEMAELLALLEQETEIATKSKMNADYVPGNVSILHGSDLEAYGVRTVADALNRIAGLYTTVNNAGDKAVVARGVGATVSATNFKMLLNGATVNKPANGSADWLLRLPIGQIDRIEVIRGPGSALHGEFAFSGVVNIIPRAANKVSATAGSHNSKQAELAMHHMFDAGAQLSANLSLWNQGNSGNTTNPDDFASFGLGFSPGQVYDHEQGLFFYSAAEHFGYKIELHHSDVERGGWYGRSAAMPQDLDPNIETSTGLQATKLWSLHHNLELGAKLELHTNELALAAFLPIVEGVDPPGPRPPIESNIYKRDKNKSQAARFNLNLHWRPSEQHTLLLDGGISHSEVVAASETSFELDGPRVITHRTLPPSRTLTSLTIQDQWRVNDQLELTLGARHDSYDDWGNHTSPRFAAVWRQGDHHIFKFQFSNAFRPPTLSELSPDPRTEGSNTLTEEKIDSTELSYIYRDSGLSLRATLFNTKAKDLIEFFIDPGQPPVFRNLGSIKSKGVELEWQQTLNRDWEFFANVSYVNAQDPTDEDGKTTGAVDWLANAGASWFATAHTRHALSLHYVGEQEGWEVRTRDEQTRRYQAYHLINYTLSIDNVFKVPELGLSFSINNVADQSYNIMPNAAKYPTGLPLGERTTWLKLTYSY